MAYLTIKHDTNSELLRAHQALAKKRAAEVRLGQTIEAYEKKMAGMLTPEQVKPLVGALEYVGCREHDDVSQEYCACCSTIDSALAHARSLGLIP